MGLGQTMLTTMFLVLLTMAAVNANRLIIDRDILFYEQEAYKQAGILANALLQEIVRKNFDSKVLVGSADTVYLDQDKFDSPGSLGPSSAAASYVNPAGAADTYPYNSIRNTDGNFFDDIDDYKGYTRLANAGSLDSFILTVDVYYVVLSSGQYVKTTASETYWKRINVTVSNSKYLKTDLVFSTIAAY